MAIEVIDQDNDFYHDAFQIKMEHGMTTDDIGKILIFI